MAWDRRVADAQAQSEENAVVLRGKLMLVDLAGSGARVLSHRRICVCFSWQCAERVKRSGVEGARFKEAVSINSGLSVLGQCIQKLSESQPQHVPYRDSKLTRLLQVCWGGGGDHLRAPSES
jgi:hypothetical protein